MIKKSTASDLPQIMDLYGMATTYQRSKKGHPWPLISESLMKQEIWEGTSFSTQKE